MKYDQSFLKDLFEEAGNINKEQDALNARKKALQDKKKEYIKAYFEQYGIDLNSLGELAISHNTFISYPEFYLKKSEDTHKMMWVAQGRRITIKDGKETYGNTRDEIWQGQWEALPEAVRSLTIAQAKESNQSVFKMSPAVFKGVDFSAPAYILHEDPSGWQLVWRKAGTAYLNRMDGSTASSSGLQVLYSGENKDFEKSFEKFQEKYSQAMGKPTRFTFRYDEITQGGRLSVGLIEKETNKIDLIFGDGTAQSIIEKLKLQSANKAQNRKSLKGDTLQEPEQIKPKAKIRL
jgi:hypothetical protein